MDWAIEPPFGVSLLIIYIAGLTAMHVIDCISSLLFRLIRPFNYLPVSSDPYWQHLAASYIGADLCPTAVEGDEALQAVELAARSGLASAESISQINESKRQLDEVEANIERLSKKITNSELKIAQALSDELGFFKKRAQAMQEERSKRISKAVLAYRWSQLHLALSYEMKSQAPSQNYDLLMLALQAAAAIQLIIFVWCKSYYHLGIFVFAGIVLITTTYTRWNIYRINNSFILFNVAPLSSILKLLRPAKDGLDSLKQPDQESGLSD